MKPEQDKDALEMLTEIMRAGDCDLHLHTHFSDGAESPQGLVERVCEAGLKAFAITDHDTIAGLKPAADYLADQAKQGVLTPQFIPGVEISADDGCEVHILGYFPRGGQEELADFLAGQQATRNQRNEKLVLRLQELGYAISREEFFSAGDGSIGRLQAAVLLQKKGYVPSIKAAFDNLLNEDRPAYISRQRPGAAEVVAVIRQAGGVAVLAHPALYNGWCLGAKLVNPFLVSRLQRLQKDGLSGVEAYHGEVSPACAAEIAAAGQVLGLLLTAGSDDHGANKDEAMLYRPGRSWPFQKATLVAAALAAAGSQDEPGWLLARRSEPGVHHGYWELPGGKVELNETPEQALKRELAEELHLDAQIGRLKYILPYAYPHREVILACYEAKLPSGWQLEVHDQIGYFTAREALRLNLLPADVALFEELAR